MNFFYIESLDQFLEFISQYSWLKWPLVGLGVLYILDEYFGFSPIDQLIDRIKGHTDEYKFEEFNHLHDEKLQQLISLFNEKEFKKVDQMLLDFNPSYRSFGFRSLGQYGKIEVSDEWISQEISASTPKIIKGYQLIHQAWEVRGRGSIDTVSKKNLKKFKEYLKNAKTTLLGLQPSPFETNVASCLLKIYKASDVEDRGIIHQTYLKGNDLNTNDAELNFSFFSCISPKWGGTEDELEHYIESLNQKDFFIRSLIFAQYYFDKVHMEGYEDSNGDITKFIEAAKEFEVDENELYKYEFYLLLYWLSNNLELEHLEEYYKSLVQPYWKD